MRQSQVFSKTLKEAPKDEKSINAKLLIRAGFVDKLMAGVYSYLPFGLRVLKKIENIIREEMNRIGGQEALFPALHPKENWQITGRWQYPEMFKIKNRTGREFGLGWTHEEVITPLVKKFVKSYKDLPLAIYQIQDKFRDELRAKSGLLRGVEFIMKDLYSFHKDEKDLDRYYEKVKKSYFQILKRCDLEKKTFLTLASGGTFSKYSHEFQTATPYGEDEIFACSKCRVAVNKGIIREHSFCPQCRSKKLEPRRAIEVGNIFKLQYRYTKAFGFNLKDKQGEEKSILMGCYGIGLSRLIGAIVEVHHDEKGICWPKEVSPFQVHLIQLGDTSKIKRVAEKIYRYLQNSGIEVLYDDREEKTAGEKFVDADLIGIPLRIVISEKTLKQDQLELKKRSQKETKLIKTKLLNSYIKKF